jgi:6-phosphogluconolactonase
VHRIGADAKLETPAVQKVSTVKTAHSAYTDRDNRWVFVPHVAPNAVYQYRFDAKTGQLTDAGKAPGGEDKAGPRHLAFHPSKNLAFTSDEEGNSVTMYGFDPETGLKPLQTLTTLPKDFKGMNSTAEVKVHPSGKFVWVSNRGHDSLAGFAIDSSGKGRITSIGQTPTEKTPRSFDIDATGRWVLAAGQDTGRLAVYHVEPNGELQPRHQIDIGKSLAWVMAVQFSEPPTK